MMFDTVLRTVYESSKKRARTRPCRSTMNVPGKGMPRIRSVTPAPETYTLARATTSGSCAPGPSACSATVLRIP